jgi:hypothetical protein
MIRILIKGRGSFLLLAEPVCVKALSFSRALAAPAGTMVAGFA